jgi:hypothetical protein
VVIVGYIDSQGNYYEGDRQGQDQEVPQIPDATYKPYFNDDGSFNSWVLDIDSKAAAIEANYQPKLDKYKDLILSAMATGGTTQTSKITKFQNKYNALLVQKNTELEAL